MKPSIASYRSVTNPQDFLVDWVSFYEQAYAKGQRLRQTTRYTAGLRYGDDPAMVMNIFHPARSNDSGVVAVYMHGGAFSEGHPDFYDFAGERLLAAGLTFVSMGYRVAPTRFPDSAYDVAQGLAVLHKHLEKIKGPARRYSLLGHSAGASIAALLGVRPELAQSAGLPADAIQSLVLISGMYDFMEPEPASNFVDASRRVEASPILHARNAPSKTLLIYGDPEVNRRANPADVFKVRAAVFEGALRAHGHQAFRLSMPNADHVATACVLENEEAVRQILQFIC